MAFSKSILLVLLMSCVIKAKPHGRSVRSFRLARLKNILVELDLAQQRAYNNMNLFRLSHGYGPFPHKPCSLDTSLMYKRVVLKQNTLDGHLTRLQMVLDPFTDATQSPEWNKNLTMLNSPTKTHVKNASFNVDKARWQIYLWNPLIYSAPLVKYKATDLDKKIQEYMKCTGIRSNPTAVVILRYATFVNSLRLAMNSREMQEDINYLATKKF